MSNAIHFTLNGIPVSADLRPNTTLLDYIRNRAGLKGTKEGCAEGDCGACTILLQRDGFNDAKPMAANSCILSLAQIEGAAVTTVEGLKREGMPSALQAAMAQNGSSQCGFCTPGFVMAATGLLASDPQADTDAIHDALAGNLCRCTGYRPIVDAVQSVLGEEPNLPDAETGKGASMLNLGESTKLLRPASLSELLAMRAQYPDATILAGGTDLGVGIAHYTHKSATIITTDRVCELRTNGVDGQVFTLGAAATWQEILDLVGDDYPSFATLIRRFGSTQIRSMGTIGGNIGTASPIGDGPPALIAMGASIVLASKGLGQRELPLEDYFLDYRKTALKSDEVIVAIKVPRAEQNGTVRIWKVSKRYDQDISTVCAAFNVKFDGSQIKSIRAAYGGMAATPKRALTLEKTLVGKSLTAEAAKLAAEALEQDFRPLSDWRGSADYRMKVAKGLVVRLAHDLAGARFEVMA